jgi:hypothetical protein
MRRSSDLSPGFRTALLVVKLAAIAAGFVGTLVVLMSVVGTFAENGWVRFLVALAVAIAVPLVIADRLLPSDPTEGGGGIVSDVLALGWLGFAFLFAVPLHGTTGKWLVREGDRLRSSGWGSLARVAYVLGGVAPSESSEPAGDPTSSSASAPIPAASASTTTVPAGSASAPAADAGAPPSSKGPEKSPAELFKDLAPSVVTIFSKGAAGQGSGTGFLIDDQGTIATNHHVIDNAGAVRIKFMSGAVFDSVELLVESAAADLALLKIDPKAPEDGGAPVTVPPLRLGDSDQVVVGERAISIGNPLGLEHTLTDGLVSSRRIYEGRAWIQMSVPVSPGNSGGPLFNMRGDVIGITTQQVMGGAFGRAQNLNLAVPINELKKLISTTYPQRRKFGQGEAPSHW